jgi:hypothetical protein
MNTAVMEQQQDQQLANYQDNMLMDVAGMQHMMAVATFMSNGTATLPETYRKNPANCLMVVMQAAQWKMSPYAVAQKTHFVNGTIGYEAQLVSAVIQQSGAVKGMFEFEWFGPWERIVGKFIERESKTKKDDYGNFKKYKTPGWTFDDEEGVGIKVSAILAGEDKPRELTLLLKQATTRNSTLWADDPKQQIAYLAQKRWARLYCPGVILGVYTRDELETIDTPEKDVTAQGSHEPAKQTQAGPAKSNDSAPFLSDEEFIGNEPAWKKRWLRGSANGLTLEAFKTWISDNTGKQLSEAQIETILNVWKPDAPKQPNTIEGQATAETISPQHQDFLNGMAQQEATGQQ